MEKQYRFDTLQVHGGWKDGKDGSFGNSITVPLSQTSAYSFESADYAGELFELSRAGNIYARLNNPTVSVFEERMALLEGGAAAVATSSGHAAQFLAINMLARAGENIVASPYLYGGTFNQFRVYFKRLGVEARFAKSDSAGDIEALIDGKTRAIYVENLGNPRFNIPDFEAIAEVAKRYKLPLVVDNTFGMGGYLCNPIKWGADVVLHSATKWIGGHGNSMGGIIIDGGKFDFVGDERYPDFSEASESYHGLVFAEQFKGCSLAVRARAEGLRDVGCCMSPFNAMMFLQGVETLSLRGERICQNAMKAAEFLKGHSKVSAVEYAGLKDNQYHKLAEKYLQNGYGGVLSFRLKGGKEAAAAFMERIKLIIHTANVGDVRTLITCPALTTHRQLDEEAQVKAGVYPDLLRLSLGIESWEDIREDLEYALG